MVDRTENSSHIAEKKNMILIEESEDEFLQQPAVGIFMVSGVQSTYLASI
jgi:hypothetical protein